MGFSKRTYRSLRDLVRDLRAVLSRRRQMGPLMRGESLDAAFRERLMLAVTAVNGCRYCSFVHARQALVAGLSGSEIEALGQGIAEGSPPDQAPALLYAQHWAEADGRPDPTAREQIVQRYGEQTTEAIELAMRVIRMANLMGNTFDLVLYRISFGRWDVDRPPRMGRHMSA
jgi:AhpD family alkylhydroperoxidase